MYRHVEPIPSTEELNEKSYASYVKDGDAFFRAGLSFDQYIEQRDRMLVNYQKTAQHQPNFYNRYLTKFDGYHDGVTCI